MKGWVYIITTKGMPDLIKVGYSGQDPELRAKGLSGTHSPHPYIVEYEALVENPYKYEQLAHKKLTDFRENEDREWFKCDLEKGISAIRAVIGTELINEDIKHIDRQKLEEAIKQKERATKKREEESIKQKARESIVKARESIIRGKELAMEASRQEESQKEKVRLEKEQLRGKIDADTRSELEGFLWIAFPWTALCIIWYTWLNLPTGTKYYSTTWDGFIYALSMTCMCLIFELCQRWSLVDACNEARRKHLLERLPYFSKKITNSLVLICLFGFLSLIIYIVTIIL